MSSSQFTIYQSSDPGNGSDQPGLLVGSANDLIRVLDKILVNGYTGKAAAGWTKPIANSGNLGCYKNSGSGMTLFVNDNGPNATPSTREAWIVGWENLTGLSGTMGVGTGQFPTTAQGDSGRLVVRKSADTTTGRQWICFADAYTFYFFSMTGDLTTGNGVYLGFGFGDINSVNGSSDAYRCMIYGRTTENSALANVGGDWDVWSSLSVTIGNANGMYMPRDFGGAPGTTAVQVLRVCDYGLSGVASSASPNNAMTTGAPYVQSPNGTDGNYMIDVGRVVEARGSSVFVMRGKMRGFYHVSGFFNAFTDGQKFYGSDDYANKQFQIVSRGPTGLVAIEISNTVETN